MKLFLFFLLIIPSLIHAKSNEVNKLLTDLVTNNIKALILFVTKSVSNLLTSFDLA